MLLLHPLVVVLLVGELVLVELEDKLGAVFAVLAVVWLLWAVALVLVELEELGGAKPRRRSQAPPVLAVVWLLWAVPLLLEELWTGRSPSTPPHPTMEAMTPHKATTSKHACVRARARACVRSCVRACVCVCVCVCFPIKDVMFRFLFSYRGKLR